MVEITKYKFPSNNSSKNKGRRYVTKNKKDIHLQITINGTKEDQEKIMNDIRTAVRRHNRRSDKEISYEIFSPYWLRNFFRRFLGGSQNDRYKQM